MEETNLMYDNVIQKIYFNQWNFFSHYFDFNFNFYLGFCSKTSLYVFIFFCLNCLIEDKNHSFMLLKTSVRTEIQRTNDFYDPYLCWLQQSVLSSLRFAICTHKYKRTKERSEIFERKKWKVLASHFRFVKPFTHGWNLTACIIFSHADVMRFLMMMPSV